VNLEILSVTKTIELLIFVAVLACTIFAAEGPPFAYRHGDESGQAVRYAPPDKVRFPAPIVIHENRA